MTTINPMIAALASEAAVGELQNAKVGSTLAGNPKPLRLDQKKVNDAMERAAKYKVGDGREDLLIIEESVRQAQYDDGDRGVLASNLARIVDGSLLGGASHDLKVFACRQLWVIGTREQIPTLAAALKDPTLSDAARYALQNMEYPEIDAALIAALDGTDPKVQIGCINSLAMRKSEGAADAIKSLKKSKAKDVAEAAKHALSRIEGKLV